jgi:hypothetical protein
MCQKIYIYSAYLEVSLDSLSVSQEISSRIDELMKV